MRRLLLRAFLIALIPLGLNATPADAVKDPPWGCELIRNTHCHCLSPSGLRDCMIIE
ncbi:MAG TPA: hypothetical protein VNB24_03800 [Acidimicrobiales bacterium]|nr:hypothetical protein [Acidimicrobiales bacterium]